MKCVLKIGGMHVNSLSDRRRKQLIPPPSPNFSNRMNRNLLVFIFALFYLFVLFVNIIYIICVGYREGKVLSFLRRRYLSCDLLLCTKMLMRLIHPTLSSLSPTQIMYNNIYKQTNKKDRR